MESTDDSGLLRQYAEKNSDEAFGALVTRHINLVYSVALRRTGNPHHAEEIAQAVFIILAQKAAGLRHEKALSSWLFQATRLTANNFARSESRRQRREQEASMQSIFDQSGTNTWERIAPFLDDAVDALSEKERRAVILRFYEGRNLQEVGAALGTSEEAAKKRVARALEKLQRFFLKRGIASTTAGITGIISTHSVQVAPAALAKSIALVAATKGVAASGSTLTLVKGALKIMAWAKAKTAIVVGVGVLLMTTTATVSVYKFKAHQAYLVARDSWRVPQITSQIVAAAMPQVRIMPTKFKEPIRGSVTDGTGKWAGINAPVMAITRAAYNWPPGRIVFRAGEPKERYDFATTLPQGAAEALQKELKNTLGLVARPETMNTDVLVLRVRDSNNPGLTLHVPGSPLDMKYDTRGRITSKGLPISPVAPDREWGFTRYLQMYLNVPVIDETGLTGIYDIDFKWREKGQADPNHNAMKQVMLDQLGLELVPTNMPIEILVVEKVK